MNPLLAGIRSTVVGMLLSVSAAGAQAVAPPSSEFKTYIEGELVRVSIPSNWRELPGSNAVTFAPEGAYRNAGVKSVFTHGLEAQPRLRSRLHGLRAQRVVEARESGAHLRPDGPAAGCHRALCGDRAFGDASAAANVTSDRSRRVTRSPLHL